MIRFRTFGSVDLRRPDETAVHTVVAQPKRLALLAYLTLSRPRGFHRRDTILALLWPELDDLHARAALNKSVHHLRRSLGQDVLVGRGTDELAIASERVWSDVVAFDEAIARGNLEQALSLYRGPLLDGFFLSEAPEFERWLETERGRLAAAAAGAAGTLAEHMAGSGRMEEAIRFARLATELRPDDEPSFRRLLFLLDSAGDRAGAASAFEEFSRRLEADYEVTASAETQAMMNAIRERAEPNGHVDTGQSLPFVSSDAAELAAGGSPGEAQEAEVARPVPDIRSRRGRSIALVLGIGATATLVAGLWAVREKASPERDVVLVLPFANETGDAEFDAVGRLAADWFVRVLMESGVADVVDSRSTFSGLDSGGIATPSAVARLARRTGASRVVGGAVYREGDFLRLHAQVTRVPDGTILFEPAIAVGPAADPSALVNAIAERLIGSMAAAKDGRFTPVVNRVAAPPRFDAYKRFVDGLDLLSRNNGDASYWAFMDAARMDTMFVQAKIYALLHVPQSVEDSLIAAAELQSDRMMPYDRAALDYAIAQRDRDNDRWLAAARRMEALAPLSADAQLFHAQAAMYTNHFSEALETLHRTEPVRGWLDDSDVFMNWDAMAHHRLGDFAGELEEVQHGRYRTDFNPCLNTYLITPLAALGRESVIDSLNIACESIPGAVNTGAFYLTAGIEYSEHGYRDAAGRAFASAREWYTRNDWQNGLAEIEWIQRDWVAVAERLRMRFPADSPVIPPLAGRLGVAAAHLGDTAVANDMVRRLDDSFERSAGPNQAVWSALIVAALGRHEEAIARLDDANRSGFRQLTPFHGRMAPGLDPLRGIPRFEAMRADRRN